MEIFVLSRRSSLLPLETRVTGSATSQEGFVPALSENRGSAVAWHQPPGRAPVPSPELPLPTETGEGGAEEKPSR